MIKRHTIACNSKVLGKKIKWLSNCPHLFYLYINNTLPEGICGIQITSTEFYVN